MKKILWCFMAVAAVLFYGCRQQTEGVCRIHGTIPEKFNDKRIFLVPMTGPATAANVDSIEIKDGKFEFTSDTLMMGKILVDYHYRLGIQPLLVVVEPGDVTVVIDTISHAYGTPQNDSLEKWKTHTEIHNQQLRLMRKTAEDLKRKGDKAQADYIEHRADSFHLVYKNFTRQMAANLKEGLLHDFLKGLYPLTYKRQLSDGRIVTMNSDTNEEITE